jgi:hypothetical protein
MIEFVGSLIGMLMNPKPPPPPQPIALKLPPTKDSPYRLSAMCSNCLQRDEFFVSVKKQYDDVCEKLTVSECSRKSWRFWCCVLAVEVHVLVIFRLVGIL